MFRIAVTISDPNTLGYGSSEIEAFIMPMVVNPCLIVVREQRVLQTVSSEGGMAGMVVQVAFVVQRDAMEDNYRLWSPTLHIVVRVHG